MWSNAPAPVSDALEASADALLVQKHALKHAMREWEHAFEEANGGLVPTHEDKKHDARYTELKTQAKHVEQALARLPKEARKASALRERESRAATRASHRACSTAASLQRSSSSIVGKQASGLSSAAGGSGVGGGAGGIGGGGFVSGEAVDGDEAADGFAFESGTISLSPFHVLLLVLAGGVPYALFIMGFALMGFGAMVYDYLIAYNHLFYPLSLSAVALLAALYIFDVSYWEFPPAVVARRVLLSTAGTIVVLGGMLASDEYPYAPLLLLFFLAPGYWWLLHKRALYTWPLADYLHAICYAMLLLSLAACALWLAWVFNGNDWTVANKRRYMLQMSCCEVLSELPLKLYEGGYPAAQALLAVPPHEVLAHLNVTSPVATSSVWDGLRWPTSSANVSLIGWPPILATENASEALSPGPIGDEGLLFGAAVDESGCLVLPTQPCLSVLLFYCSPFVTGCAGFVGGALAMLLARMLKQDERQSGGLSVGVGGRVFLLTLAIAAASLWVSASIAGASMGVTKVITLGVVVLCVVMTLLIERVFGWKVVLQAVLTREPFMRRLVKGLVTSDWCRALAVAVASPLVLVLLVLSVANQAFRVSVLRSVVLPSERQLWVTQRVSAILSRLAQWNWSSILRKVIVITFSYIVLVVGVMKVTMLLFSYLTHVLRPQPLWLSTLVFVAVALTMFLLPPVPGAPVYITAGVLLTPIAEQTVGGYVPAVLYAMAVGFVTKLGACALQQKLIGANLGRSVRVRSAVMVNSPLMRAIAVMMSKPGLSKGKVATLTGGPDWPTSVMMGILGMPLLPMLLGTLPVIALIAPGTCIGAFMIRGPVAPFPALTNLAIAASSIAQVGAFLAMMLFVERATHQEARLLETMPYDEEVLALDRAEKDYQALYAELTAWRSKDVPRALRAVLVVGALSGIAACHVVTLFDTACFRDFALYPDYTTQLRDKLGGEVSNLVRPPGYAVLGASALAFLCREVFRCWAARLVRARYAAGARAGGAAPVAAATAPRRPVQRV